MGNTKKPLVEGRCAYCGQSFLSNRFRKRFCNVAADHDCPKAFARLMEKRGKVILPFVMAWLEGKGGGHSGVHPVAAQAMRELTSIGRIFLDEDKTAGRPPMIPYVESLLAEGLYIDRRRS